LKPGNCALNRKSCAPCFSYHAFSRTDARRNHDIVEDTEYTLEDLRQNGVPEEVVEAVSLLTKQKGLPEQEYYNRIKKNQVAKTVKLADLRHNSDLTRLNVIDDSVMERHERYQEKISFLKEDKTSR
jgi:hypothetical protein